MLNRYQFTVFFDELDGVDKDVNILFFQLVYLSQEGNEAVLLVFNAGIGAVLCRFFDVGVFNNCHAIFPVQSVLFCTSPRMCSIALQFDFTSSVSCFPFIAEIY